MNHPFLVLLIIALAIGVGIGGVFAGGVALGKSSGGDTPPPLSLGGPAANSTGGAGPGQFSLGPGQSGRGPVDRSPTGRSAGPEGQFDPSSPGPGSPDPNAGDAVVQRFPGRGGVFGTVDKVEGNLVTIVTTEGPVAVTIAEDTAISQISEASVADLQPGIKVTVMGPAGGDGRVAAANLVITPEGMENPFSRGQLSGRSFPPGTAEP